MLKLGVQKGSTILEVKSIWSFCTFNLSKKIKEKDLVISNVKDCYDKNLYSDVDIYYITKDTSKEKEMNLYLEKRTTTF